MEFLKEKLGEELYNQVSEKLKGSGVKLADLSTGDYVDKNKYDKLDERNKDLDKQLKGVKTKLTEFEGMDVEAIKKESLEWKEKYETAETDWKNKENQRLYDDGLEKVLKEKYNAKDIKSIKAHLNHEAITRDGENFIGLEDQMKPLTESNAWLFEEKQSDGTPPPNFTKPNESTPPPAGGEIKFNFTGVRPKPTSN